MEVGEIHVKFSGFSLVFRLRNMQHRCDVGGGGDHHFGDEDDESDAFSMISYGMLKEPDVFEAVAI